MADELAEIGDRFAVVTQAARGGMGVVYKARDLQTGKIVAVKLMHGTDRENFLRFEREANILSELDHPAIVHYVAHGTSGGRPYLAMEWVEGETLHSRLERTGLSIADSLELARRVADALGYAHARGVVHRDIKPTNIILRDSELARVAILDFGVARAPASGSLTSTGALVGTPAYMAPEQARGERQLGPPVDVFALGCVLYECLTARRAFEGKHVLALIAKVVLWDPPRPRTLDPAVPTELDEVVTRMIAKDPNVRLADGNAVRDMLAPIAFAQGPTRRGRSEPAMTAVVQRADSPTVLTNSVHARLASIVIATPPGAADADELLPEVPPPAWAATGQLIAALNLLNVRHEVMRDGSILAAVTTLSAEDSGISTIDTGPVRPLDVVERAISAARAIQRIVPDALIAIATGEVGEGDVLTAMIGTLLDETVGALAREAMAMVFAGVSAPLRPEGAIRIDERTARILPDSAVVRVKSTYYAKSEPKAVAQ